MINLIVSARKKPDIPMGEFIKPSPNIMSVFGFVEHSKLYGGRRFLKPDLTQDDVTWLYDHNIGLKLPLTNMFTTYEEFVEAKPFLRKYHRPNNSVTVANDELARMIKIEFPAYTIDASAIKNIKTNDEINSALDLYDRVVLRSNVNDDDEFLKSIDHKDDVILFESIGRSHGCNSKVCFMDISKYNAKWTPALSSETLTGPIPRCARPGGLDAGPDFQHFDINHLNSLGFNTFKVMRQNGPKWSC